MLESPCSEASINIVRSTGLYTAKCLFSITCPVGEAYYLEVGGQHLALHYMLLLASYLFPSTATERLL